MKIDLSSVNIFEDNELELDKKITFIFGKKWNGKIDNYRRNQEIKFRL